tara:strand:- start:1933 stop:2649 length:717 start_codon:yes stop_codon:yes gene_type:complete
MNAVTSDIIEKVQKLLRMADETRGASQQERETAMRKAQELITRHGLEMAQMRVDEGRTEVKVGRDDVVTDRPQYDYDTYVAKILKKCFKVHVVWSTYYANNGKKRLKICLVGTPEDTMMAREAMPTFVSAMKDGLSFYLSSRGVKWNSADANGFYRGVADGYIKASEEGQQRAYASATKDNVDAYAVVLVDTQKAITAFVANEWSNLRTTTQRRGHSNAAYGAGVVVGAGVSTRRKLS